jgi:hypothetical protein
MRLELDALLGGSCSKLVMGEKCRVSLTGLTTVPRPLRREMRPLFSSRSSADRIVTLLTSNRRASCSSVASSEFGVRSSNSVWSMFATSTYRGAFFCIWSIFDMSFRNYRGSLESTGKRKIALHLAWFRKLAKSL